MISAIGGFSNPPLLAPEAVLGSKEIFIYDDIGVFRYIEAKCLPSRLVVASTIPSTMVAIMLFQSALWAFISPAIVSADVLDSLDPFRHRTGHFRTMSLEQILRGTGAAFTFTILQ